MSRQPSVNTAGTAFVWMLSVRAFKFSRPPNSAAVPSLTVALPYVPSAFWLTFRTKVCPLAYAPSPKTVFAPTTFNVPLSVTDEFDARITFASPLTVSAPPIDIVA